jgi:hypothetical protein
MVPLSKLARLVWRLDHRGQKEIVQKFDTRVAMKHFERPVEVAGSRLPGEVIPDISFFDMRQWLLLRRAGNRSRATLSWSPVA